MAVIPFALFGAFMRLVFAAMFHAVRLLFWMMTKPAFWALVHLLVARHVAWLAWESGQLAGYELLAAQVGSLLLIITVLINAGYVVRRVVRAREYRQWWLEQRRLEAEHLAAWEKYRRDFAAWQNAQQQAVAA